MESIQYIIIAIVFVIALVYVVRKFIPTKGSSGGCGKGCNCDASKSADPSQLRP